MGSIICYFKSECEFSKDAYNKLSKKERDSYEWRYKCNRSEGRYPETVCVEEVYIRGAKITPESIAKKNKTHLEIQQSNELHKLETHHKDILSKKQEEHKIQSNPILDCKSMIETPLLKKYTDKKINEKNSMEKKYKEVKDQLQNLYNEKRTTEKSIKENEEIMNITKNCKEMHTYLKRKLAEAETNKTVPQFNKTYGVGKTSSSLNDFDLGECSVLWNITKITTSTTHTVRENYGYESSYDVDTTHYTNNGLKDKIDDKTIEESNKQKIDTAKINLEKLQRKMEKINKLQQECETKERSILEEYTTAIEKCKTEHQIHSTESVKQKLDTLRKTHEEEISALQKTANTEITALKEKHKTPKSHEKKYNKII